MRQKNRWQIVLSNPRTLLTSSWRWGSSVFRVFDVLAKRPGQSELPSAPNPEPRPGRKAAPNIPERDGALTVSVLSDHSYLSKGSKFNGRLFSEGPVNIDGEAEGEIESQKTIMIGESGVVTAATIKADSVIVAGAASADTAITSQRIEIRASGRVWGNLASNSIVVDDGGQLEGQFVWRPYRNDATSQGNNLRTLPSTKAPENLATTELTERIDEIEDAQVELKRPASPLLRNPPHLAKT